MNATFDGSVGAGLLVLGLFLALAVLSLATFLFWVWMLVDCARLPDDATQPNQRVLWTLALVFANILAAVIYYLAVKRPADAARRAGGSVRRVDRFPRTHG